MRPARGSPGTPRDPRFPAAGVYRGRLRRVSRVDDRGASPGEAPPRDAGNGARGFRLAHLGALLGLLRIYPAAARFFMLCSDEEDPSDLASIGHMDHKLRMTVRAGVDPVAAITMASLNSRRFSGSTTSSAGHSGQAGGPRHLRRPRELQGTDGVLERPACCRERQQTSEAPVVDVPDFLRSGVDFPRPFVPDDFRIRAEGSPLMPASSVSTKAPWSPTRNGGPSGSRRRGPRGSCGGCPELAVIDRHSPAAHIGQGFVEGLGLSMAPSRRPTAMSIQPPVGREERRGDGARGNVVREMGGGMAVVRRGEVVARWELPIVGIFSASHFMRRATRSWP